jgi:predicted RecA/RadA family phage recombinase
MDSDFVVVGSLVSVSVVDEAGENGEVIAVLVFVYAEDMAAPTEANWLFIDCVVEENPELAEGVVAVD